MHVPEGITQLELDTIKLTAQFVARNGKNFLTGLASRQLNQKDSAVRPARVACRLWALAPRQKREGAAGRC